jgi:hypothetical protein
MNGGFEWIWKEAVVAWLKFYSRICLEGLRETMKEVGQDGWCPYLYSKFIAALTVIYTNSNRRI